MEGSESGAGDGVARLWNGAGEGREVAGVDESGAGRAATDRSGAGVDWEGTERAAPEGKDGEDISMRGEWAGHAVECAARTGSRRGGGRRTLGRPEPDGCGCAGGRAGASLRAGCAVHWRRVRALQIDAQ